MIKEFIIAMRPRQCIKNLIVFAAIIFAQKLGSPDAILKAIFAFICFCIISGCGYVFNDILDVERDKIHPQKKNRPIASGRLKILPALLLSVILVATTLLSSFLFIYQFGIVILGYFILTTCYSLFLKNVVIVDVIALALGYVLRVVGGAVIIQVHISLWLLICTTLLALFLGLGKRRHELVLLEENAVTHRAILKEYTPSFIDGMIAAVTGSTIIAYALYTIDPKVQEKLGTIFLPLSIPFVLYGIFRYLYLVHQKSAGGSPDVDIIKDKPMLLNIILWIITIIIIVYLKPMG
jgi:4-hydroxybenzoate polyprenyltransferase